MKFEYIPQNVCCKKMVFEIENNKVIDLIFYGGCPGNTKGVSALIKNHDLDYVIERLDGIKCTRSMISSCPNEVATALKSFKNKK